jgi:hypothetical protein
MRCAQCFIVVSSTCPTCREIFQRAKDALELLSRRAVLVVNVEDFPLVHALEYFAWDPRGGMTYKPAATPQFICLVRDESGRWAVAYRHPITSAEQLHEMRRYLEAKAHWLKVTVGRVCYETRGRRRGEGAGEGGTARRGGR